MNLLKMQRTAMRLGLASLVVLAGCSRHDATPADAGASSVIDRTNATGAGASGGGPTVDDPSTRAASAAASAVLSSQATGTQQAPGSVTLPPEGSTNTRGGPGPK